MPPGDDGWKEWSKFVLKELKRLGDACEEFPKAIQGLTQKVNDEISQLKAEVAMLKVKSGIWGSIGAIIVIGIVYLSRYIGG